MQIGKWKCVDNTHSISHYMLRGIEGTIMYNNEQLKNEVEGMLIR